MRGFSRQRDYVALDAADGGNDADMLIWLCPANAASKRTPTPLFANLVIYVLRPEWLEASLSPTAL